MSLTRRILRRTWWIVRWPLGVAVVLIAALFLINVRDEPLSPQAQAMLQPPPNPYADQDNLFVLLAGIDAPSGESIVARGRANTAAFRKAVASREHLTPAKLADLGRTPEAQRLPLRGELPKSDRFASSIWESSRSAHAPIAERSNANRGWLERYESLRAAKGYHEDQPADSLAPIYYVPTAVHVLYLERTAARAQSGTAEEQLAAIRSLIADMGVWRMMLGGYGTLVSKMLAGGWLHADLIVLGDMVTDPSVPVEVLRALETQLTPWPISDWKMGNAFPAEFRFVHAQFSNMDRDQLMFDLDDAPHWLGRHWSPLTALYKPNATANIQAGAFDQLRLLAEADSGQYAKSLQGYQSWYERSAALAFPGISYNPVGRILVALSFSNSDAYVEYTLRPYDVAAFQRLVALACQLRVQGVSRADVPAFMKTHPEISTHPVDGAPFVWNAALGKIKVVPRSVTNRSRRFTLRIFPTP